MANLSYRQQMEGDPQFRFHPDYAVLAFAADEKLDLPAYPWDEGGRTYRFCLDGDGGCVFSREDTYWQ